MHLSNQCKESMPHYYCQTCLICIKFVWINNFAAIGGIAICIMPFQNDITVIFCKLSTPMTNTWEYVHGCKLSLGWHIGNPGVVMQAGWKMSPIIYLSYKHGICRRLHYNFLSRSALSVISIHTHACPVLMWSDCTNRHKEVAIWSETLPS